VKGVEIMEKTVETSNVFHNDMRRTRLMTGIAFARDKKIKEPFNSHLP
jgi:hypothetical protein